MKILYKIAILFSAITTPQMAIAGSAGLPTTQLDSDDSRPQTPINQGTSNACPPIENSENGEEFFLPSSGNGLSLFGDDAAQNAPLPNFYVESDNDDENNFFFPLINLSSDEPATQNNPQG